MCVFNLNVCTVVASAFEYSSNLLALVTKIEITIDY